MCEDDHIFAGHAIAHHSKLGGAPSGDGHPGLSEHVHPAAREIGLSIEDDFALRVDQQNAHVEGVRVATQRAPDLGLIKAHVFQ